MKKGKMKDYERIYIEHSKASVEEIAKELDRPISTIKKWIAKTATKLVNEVFVESTQPTKPISKPEPLTKSLFVRPKVNDKKFGAIMTHAASEASDESRKNMNLKTNKHDKSIHRMFEE
jgi:hypothetical protein